MLEKEPEMKQVLVLTRYFPPTGEVGGFRAEGWTKYLPSHGFQLTILSPRVSAKQEDLTVLSENAELLLFDYNNFDEGQPLLPTKIGSLANRFFAYTSSRLEKNNFYTVATQLIGEKEFDLIIVTAPPFFMLKIGELLHKNSKIPWIADSRDAWTTNRVSRSIGGSFLQLLYESLEQRTLSTSLFISTVSPTNVPSIKRVNPNKDVVSIENGFFEEDLAEVSADSADLKDVINICYLGTLYEYQPIEEFLAASDKYCNKRGVSANFKFIGLGKQKNASQRIKSIQVSERVNIEVTPKMDRGRALEFASDCDVLLLLAHPTIDQVLTKVYDYLALRKPIIMFKDDLNFMGDMLRGFSHCFLCEDEFDILKSLESVQEGCFIYPEKPDLMRFTREYFTSIFGKKINDELS